LAFLSELLSKFAKPVLKVFFLGLFDLPTMFPVEPFFLTLQDAGMNSSGSTSGDKTGVNNIVASKVMKTRFWSKIRGCRSQIGNWL